MPRRIIAWRLARFFRPQLGDGRRTQAQEKLRMCRGLRCTSVGRVQDYAVSIFDRRRGLGAIAIPQPFWKLLNFP